MRRPVSGKQVYHPRREVRRKLATERQVISSAQTPEQRLAALDDRLGVGVGAVRERLRLHARIAQLAAQAQAQQEKAEKKAAKAEK